MKETGGEADFSGVLVDTSAWIKFFREGNSPEAAHLSYLLEIGQAAYCAPIRVEVISGARSAREFALLEKFFSALILFEISNEIWAKVEDARFRLARMGYQAAIVDLVIACVAENYKAPLWSLDSDFKFIREVINFPRYIPEQMR